MADSDLKFPEAASRVVDEFTPTCSLHLSWDNGNKVVAEGDQVTPTQAQDLPTLRFDGDKDKLYTIIISDPDAPSVADPKFGEWQHMIVVNAPSSDFASGEAITAYFGSAPGKDSGMHRYCVVVYEQPDKIVPDEEKISATSGFPPRRSFKSRAFAAKYNLVPVAVLTYLCEWDESVPALAAKLQGLPPPTTA